MLIFFIAVRKIFLFSYCTCRCSRNCSAEIMVSDARCLAYITQVRQNTPPINPLHLLQCSVLSFRRFVPVTVCLSICLYPRILHSYCLSLFSKLETVYLQISL